MYPVTVIEPETKKPNILKVDIVFSLGNQKRKFFGITREPHEVYSLRYYQRDSIRKDYHVSRHGSGRVYQTIGGRAAYYPIKGGELGAPIPIPFRIKIAEPERPPIEHIQGVEQLWLYDLTELGGLLSPGVVFQDCSVRKSDADYQIIVELDQFAEKLLGFRVFLLEPGQEALLNDPLGQVSKHLSQDGNDVFMSQVNIYTGASPWLAIALLAKR